MVRQFFSYTVAVELLIATAWGITLLVVSRHYARPFDGKTLKLKSDYLKTPTSNALTVLGLVVPILVALTSYLYASRPDANYGSLLSTIIVYFCVLIIAIWETFAILKKATEDDTITLTYPDDLRFITGLGLMYGMLILGLCYFGYFFLFEISPASPKAADTSPSVSRIAATYFVARPSLPVDGTREDALRSWGTPARVTASSMEYELDNATMQIKFDSSGRIEQMIVTRRK
jgi:hypothetical protein